MLSGDKRARHPKVIYRNSLNNEYSLFGTSNRCQVLFGPPSKEVFSAIPGGRFQIRNSITWYKCSFYVTETWRSGHYFPIGSSDVLKLWALNYIGKEDLTIDEIACLVRYSDQLAFSRAFKNPTGKQLLSIKEKLLALSGRRTSDDL